MRPAPAPLGRTMLAIAAVLGSACHNAAVMQCPGSVPGQQGDATTYPALTLTVKGSRVLVAPPTQSAFFGHQSDPEVPALRAIADAFVVPAHVRGGGLSLGALRAQRGPDGASLLDDDDLEATVRDWVYHHGYWTGSNEATTPPLADNIDALEIYRWRMGGTGPTGTVYPTTNADLHGGLGPTMACATIHYLYLGLLSAYGIAGRYVWGRQATGNNDVCAEYWSPRQAKWVHVMAHVNAHIEFADDSGAPSGVRCAMLEWTGIERTTGGRDGGRGMKVVGLGLGGSMGLDQTGQQNAGYWSGFSVGNDWGRGNAYVTSWNAFPDHAGDGVKLYDPSLVLPIDESRDPNRKLSTQRADVDYSVNALSLDASVLPDGRVHVQLGNDLVEFSRYEVLSPDADAGAGAWSALPATGIYEACATAGTWRFRAVGVAGNTTNVAQLVVSPR